MWPGCGISGELKAFRNYFLKLRSNVSCFYDLKLPREPCRVGELPQGAEWHHG
jgi:hypothetical protein